MKRFSMLNSNIPYFTHAPLCFFMTILAFLTIPSLFRPVIAKKAPQVCTSISACSTSASPSTMTTVSPPQSYTKLASLCKDISSLSEVLGLLSWDEQVMMPSGSAKSRGLQKAVLTSIVHNKSTSDQLRDAITQAQKDLDQLNEYQSAVVRDAHRSFQRAIGVPDHLERELAQHEVHCVQAWVKARQDDDYELFIPYLEKTFQLAKEKALAMVPDADVYDTRIDIFERGMSAMRVREIFDGIKIPLKKVLDKTLEMKKNCKTKVHPALSGSEEWTVEKQEQLSKDLCNALGFDFNKGRLDVSVHPFTGGAGPDDVRITTRYSSDVPFEGIMATVHEVGHAMYEQGRNEEYLGLPVSEPLSMGVHESQSLFWERMIGQTLPFWEFVLPLVHERLPHTKETSARDLFFAVNQVTPDLIRVNADELTYPFHIMLRFDIEQQLFNGDLQVKDIPMAWKKAMKEYLDVDVPSDAQGCLQDIHWPSAAFGYFPSYSLGAMTAAQLFAYLEREVMPDIEERIAKGDLKTIRQWLAKEIHEKGSLYTSLDSLLENVTGEPLNTKYFLDYLEQKYAKVYAN